MNVSLLACRFLVPVAVVASLSACQPVTSPPRDAWPALVVGDRPTANLEATCVADFHPGTDYFPHKTAFTHSTQLQVNYHRHYKHVRFTPSIATGETLDYLLVQCGTPVPPHGAHVQVIQVPIQRLVTGNSAMLGALDELGLTDRLYGSESTRSATVPAVRERVARGLVHDMWGYGHMSIEPVMAVQADVYLSFYSAYPQGNMHPRLWELGVRAVPQADHHEPHPLGRAEWLKWLALMANREAAAETQFQRIESQYQQLAAIAATATQRPRVMGGFASGRDSFETFGAGNQRAQLIRDAGGEYVLGDTGSTASLVYESFETMYAAGANADVWIGVLGGRPDVSALVADNALNGWFGPARAQRVYAWDLGYTGAWASPYQDQSMTRPHILLAEVMAVLHPGLASRLPAAAHVPPGHASAFLRPLR